jgi:hypothetical protein
MKCKIKKEWINIEMEHKNLFPKNQQKNMAKKIAQGHVQELGCGYYPALIKMEKKLKKLNKAKL